MDDELKVALENISLSYEDFVYGILHTVKGKDDKQRKLLDYIKDHPDLDAGDINTYVDDELCNYMDGLSPDAFETGEDEE